MKEISESLTFWVLLSVTFGFLAAMDGWVWIPHAMLASANVGAKCVRREGMA